MTLIIDASVAIKWFVEEPGSDMARRLLTSGPDHLEAPELLVAEVCNAAWKSQRLGQVSVLQFDLITSRIEAMFGRLWSLGPLASRASGLAKQLDHPVYDCFYLALSEARRTRLVTADGKLLSRLKGTEWSELAVSLYETAAMQ